MSAQRLLIRNGFVVSIDPDIGDVYRGEVLVEDGKIVDIGQDLGVSDAEQIDATGMIVMPASSTRTGTPGRRRSAASCRRARSTTTSR